jgi:hypothetical protein
MEGKCLPIAKYISLSETLARFMSILIKITTKMVTARRKIFTGGEYYYSK